MKRVVLLSALCLATTAGLPAQTPAAAKVGKALDIYVADTEGGKAVLFVSPTGQTLLIDSGNPGERDLTRIMAMIGEAGVKQIDYLISTHYHVDHIGGMQELSKRIPIGTYIDHGPNTEPKDQMANFSASYEQVRGTAKHMVVKPGDRIPITGLDWRIVTSAGQVLKTALPGGGRPNPACATFQKRPDPATPDDNAASVGSVVTYGQFKLIDLGDLLWNQEGELMCPNNPVGTVDLFMVTHHGLAQSNADPLVLGVRPRVALMQNGTRKGGAVPVFETLRKSPGFEDVWQLHWSYAAGIEHNAPGVFIANVDDNATIAGVLTAPAGGNRGAGGGPPPTAGTPPAAPGAAPAGATSTPSSPATAAPAPGGAPGQPGTAPAAPAGGQGAAGQPGAPGAGRGGGGGGRGGGAAAAHTPAYYIKVSAQADGTFTVTNTRNGFSKTYAKRAN
jgi:beta-lactamase superfamily II metal-dependent hydrolase